MKKIKQVKGFGIFENNKKEIEEYGFNFTILTPDNMEYPYMCSPADTDMEFNTLAAAVDFINEY